MIGSFFSGFGFSADMDAPEELRMENIFGNNLSLAEKAKALVESSRLNYYQTRSTYFECREGGRRYKTTLDAYGPKSAAALAEGAKTSFENVCKNALMDEDGNSTDPTIPTTRMVNMELRRLRANTILMVGQHINYFESMMSDNVRDWTRGEFMINGSNLVSRYNEGCYQDLSSFLSVFKKTPKTPYELHMHYEEFFDSVLKRSDSRTTVMDELQNYLADFICSALPHNEARLQKEADQAEKAGAIH